MKNYILKEYGSWSVLLFSLLGGIIVAGRMELNLLLTFLGLCLFINSKQAYVTWQRLKRRKAFFVFIFQIMIGFLILLMAEGGSIFRLFPLVLIPLLYLLSLNFSGEHSIFTEVAGFLTLCLASLVAYFSLTNEIDLRFYLAVSLFFIAGVFKVRLQLKRGIKERVSMLAYLIATVLSYLLLDHNPLILLPLIDNLIFALTLYRARLQVTGWIEVSKGALFLVLLSLLW